MSEKNIYTIHVEELGDIQVRKQISGAEQEALVSEIVSHIVDAEGQYWPLRKEPLLLTEFVANFVVGGRELMSTDESGAVDIYAEYDRLEAGLNLMATARAQCAEVDRIMSRLEHAVDLEVFHVRERWNAVIAGGLNTTTGETMAALDGLVEKASGLVGMAAEFLEKNGKKISKLISQKNYDKAMEMIGGMKETVSRAGAAGAQ